MKNKNNLRGGEREGAGRPTLKSLGIKALVDENKINVRLTDEEKKKAIKIGAGNVSAGIRAAIAAFKIKNDAS